MEIPSCRFLTVSPNLPGDSLLVFLFILFSSGHCWRDGGRLDVYIAYTRWASEELNNIQDTAVL